mmetsp:Transcript_39873/g.59437  ORF Transcript_39873/g.59437 Transcript_39873/m.59437 type:complete len:435 (+) Transcript_39873:28-1332(+)
MRLFCSVVYDDLNTWAYDASVAGLGYSLDFSLSLSLSVGGFSDKLPDLLAVLLDRMNQVVVDSEASQREDGTLTERGQELWERLEVQRQLLVQSYNNLTREEPWSVCSYYVTQLMARGSWHIAEYLEAIEEPLTLTEMAQVVRSGLSKAQVEVLVHGNASVEQSNNLSGQVVRALEDIGAKPLEQVPKRQITKLPAGSETIFEYDLGAENPAQENSCTQNVYQVGPVGEDLARDAALSMICHIAGNSAYQRLRTEEQLGYIVQASVWAEQHVAGLSVIVQGNRLAPCDADKRIEAWLESFEKELEEMSAEDFANNVQAVINQRTERYSRMSQETSKHWAEIHSRRYRFDSSRKSVKALEEVKQSDVVALFRESIAASASGRRKLSARVIGTSAGEARTDGSVLRSLRDIRDLHAAGEAFPDPMAERLPEVTIAA